MNKLILAIFVFSVLHTLSWGQTVTYDFEKQEFDQVFPFDKAFKIMVIGLPPGTEQVEIEIKNITNASRITRKLLKNSAIKRIRKDDIFNHDLAGKPIYMASEGVIGKDSTGTAIIELAPLPPNQSYYIKIAAVTLKNIDARQKTDVRNIIMQEGIIADFSNDLLTEALSPSKIRTSGLDLSFISGMYEDFTVSLEDVLKKYDASYEILKPKHALQTDVAFQTASATIFTGFENLIIQLREFNDDIRNSGSSDTLNISQLLAGDLIKDQTEIFNNLKNEINKKSNALDKSQPLADIDSFLTTLSAQRSIFIGAITRIIENDVVNNLVKRTETLNRNFETDLVKNANTYVSADIGYGYTPEIHRHFGFTAVNVYFRSINNTVPISHYTGFGDFMLARTSLVAGMTLIGDIDKKYERKGIVEGKGIMLGVGFKALPWLKFNVGGMFYNKIISPLVSEKELGKSLFFSAAIDFSLKPTFVEALKNK